MQIDISEIRKMEDGNAFSGYYYVSSLEQRNAKNGNPFVIVTLEDKTGRITMNLWKTTEDDVETLRNKAVFLEAKVGSYQDTKQIDFQLNAPGFTLKAVDENEMMADPSLYKQASPYSIEEAKKTVSDLIFQIDNEVLQRIVRSVLDSVGDSYYVYPAAQRIHEAYEGGLAYHSVKVTNNALALARGYEGMNLALIIAGALLHDIGKIKELSIDGGYSYSLEGGLIGHVILSDQYVVKAINDLNIEETNPIVMQLRNLILSHHGRREWGAATLPSTPEAFIVSEADNIDAKLQQMFTMRQEIGSGGMSKSMFRLDDNNATRIFNP